jgi:hypothetical protein
MTLTLEQVEGLLSFMLRHGVLSGAWMARKLGERPTCCA